MKVAVRDTPLCLNCGTRLAQTLVDLGLTPLANSFVPLDRAHVPEPVYPLHARICHGCWLVQVEKVVTGRRDILPVRVLLVLLGTVGWNIAGDTLMT